MHSLCKPPEWIVLEHEAARILTEQELNGWYFDERAARELASSLQKEYEETHKVLRERHPFIEGVQFTPKRNNKTQGYVAGAPFTKLKELNPTSRDHITWLLTTHYGWNPTSLTSTGKAIVDETVLKGLDLPIAKSFLTLLDITKKLGMISEGTNAWLKLVTKSERIHHHCSVATSTHRCAHRNPNLAQVPSGSEFRKLFRASPGQLMVGADLSGVELRCLAHYLARYDGGRYGEILLNDDIHQVNADKIGISRKLVKTVTYAFLYGAGDQKIGLSYDKGLSPNKAKEKGKEIREAYIEAIDGLGELLTAVKAAAERGFVRAIDGRKIPVDSGHKALNYLLQSTAAVLAKRWMVINQETIKKTQLCCSQLAFIHDELQFECDPEHVEDLRTSLVYSALAAGEHYKFRVPIEAEATSGETWADTH